MQLPPPPDIRPERRADAGFTLIELSIVLVIIGLIVGSVLVGRDLIAAAAVRAQISQIEKYQAAVNTFKGKYGYLPGDIRDPEATQFGFIARGTLRGEGDGNGVIEGSICWMGGNYHRAGQADGYVGEQFIFWRDLAAVKLIEGSFTTAPVSCPPRPNPSYTSSPSFYDLQPKAKIATGTLVSIWSGGPGVSDAVKAGDGTNYFGLNAWSGSGGGLGISPADAGAMDAKMDDGLPMSGRVLALWSGQWGGLGGYNAATNQPDNSATTQVPGWGCYSNGGVAGITPTYVSSTTQECHLSVRFQ